MFRASVFSILTLAIGATVSVNAAHAQSLSQLEFDQPVSASAEDFGQPKEPDPAIVQKLLEEAPEKVQPAPVVEAKPVKMASSAQAARNPEVRAALKKPEPAPQAKVRANETPKALNELKMDWERHQDGGFLVPRLKGPTTDAGSTNLITTSVVWKKNLGSCSDLSDVQSLCDKARSLKELMNRFSGNDDFYDAQCATQCSDPGQIAVLTGFAVSNFPNGSYQMVDQGNECRYQLTLRSDSWRALKGERGTCSCLPKTCL